MIEVRRLSPKTTTVCDAHLRKATSQIVATLGGDMNYTPDEQEERRVVWIDCCPGCERRITRAFTKRIAPKRARRR